MAKKVALVQSELARAVALSVRTEGAAQCEAVKARPQAKPPANTFVCRRLLWPCRRAVFQWNKGGAQLPKGNAAKV